MCYAFNDFGSCIHKFVEKSYFRCHPTLHTLARVARKNLISDPIKVKPLLRNFGQWLTCHALMNVCRETAGNQSFIVFASFAEAFNEIEVKYKGGLVTIQELEEIKVEIIEENEDLKGIVQVRKYVYQSTFLSVYLIQLAAEHKKTNFWYYAFCYCSEDFWITVLLLINDINSLSSTPMFSLMGSIYKVTII